MRAHAVNHITFKLEIKRSAFYVSRSMNRNDHLCALQFATMILVWNPMKLDIFDYIFFSWLYITLTSRTKRFYYIDYLKGSRNSKCFEYGEMELKNVTNNCVNLAVEPTGEYWILLFSLVRSECEWARAHAKNTQTWHYSRKLNSHSMDFQLLNISHIKVAWNVISCFWPLWVQRLHFSSS